MQELSRIYNSILGQHMNSYRQMAFLTGPRQVGKTTLGRSLGEVYLNWDNDDHREIVLRGPGSVAGYAGLDRLAARPVSIVFDELHKYRRWKLFLKGFFDSYETRARIIVTGSSRLDVYRRGGDSLMGRYFLFHMHPLSVGELLRTDPPQQPIRPPCALPDAEWQALWEHGGYPEPFVRREKRFYLRWRELRRVQLLRDDVRDLTRIQEIDQLRILGRLLEQRSGDQLVYGALAREIRVSENTVRSWISTLCSLYFGFLVRPWHHNISRSLRKEPKWFLRDWSGIDDAGKRAETLCACHLLKAAELWSDLGFGSFALHYVRDKERREVDFLVVRDGVPWFLVEVKHSDLSLSGSLSHFQKQIGCPHAFQLVVDSSFVKADCFGHRKPVVVPARTFLSQLP
jgi:predicted AAA+ superfamily ATPase